MSGYTLHAPPGSFRAFKALIAAEYNSVSVTVAEFDAEKVKALSPTGRAPVLETPSGVIFESNAIARYLSRVRRDTGLTGRSFYDEASVDSWVDFSSQEVELPASVWFYPVAGYMPFHEAAYDKAKADLSSALAILNDHLLDKTYLVGDQVTLADIAVVSALVYPMKLVCDKAYLKPFGNVVRWFTTCVNQTEFKAVIGQVTMCKQEVTAPGQKPKAGADGAAKEGKKKGGKKDDKKKDKKEKEAPADAPPAPVKKVEHPYKIMDREAKSPFSMDAWKKTYSNAASYDVAMATFWETFDAEGWYLWAQNYKYNEGNKRIFMMVNAIRGY